MITIVIGGGGGMPKKGVDIGILQVQACLVKYLMAINFFRWEFQECSLIQLNDHSSSWSLVFEPNRF